MAETTGISWADSTLNIWAGCTKVSNGPLGACEGCYAEHLMDRRMGRAKWGPHEARIEMKGWREALRAISRLARKANRPWFVFVNSLSDFWDKQAHPGLRKEALRAFAEHPHLTFLLLTKRPQNIERQATEAGGLPPNVILMCTVVTQAEANRDVIHLLRAASQFGVAATGVSCEPLMGEIDFFNLDLGGGRHFDAFAGVETNAAGNAVHFWRGLGWVITGGETDQGKHKARPTDLAWFRSLRDQCQAAGVPFHFKQMTRKGPIPDDLLIREMPHA